MTDSGLRGSCHSLHSAPPAPTKAWPELVDSSDAEIRTITKEGVTIFLLGPVLKHERCFILRAQSGKGARGRGDGWSRGPEAGLWGRNELSFDVSHLGYLLWERSMEVSRVTGLETRTWGCRCPGNSVEQFSL